MADLAPDRVNILISDQEAELGPGTMVLEAGCGRFKHFDYPASMLIAGLDISADQLQRNDYADEKILGDVQTHHLDRRFNVVVSVFVLEHLEDPEAALDNMLKWTLPGGLLVIAVPNALSVKGLVTKFTPFWFHEFAYKFFYRRKYSIFPTTMKLAIAPGSLRRIFRDHEILHEQYAEETLAQPFGAVYGGLMWLLRLVTLGRWQPQRSNYLVVVRKIEKTGNSEV